MKDGDVRPTLAWGTQGSGEQRATGMGQAESGAVVAMPGGQDADST